MIGTSPGAPPGPGAGRIPLARNEQLIEAVRDAAREAADSGDLLRRAVEAIHASSAGYDWTGIYLLNGEELVLNHFAGKPSPHERIPIGEGICGAAVRERRTLIVPDVNRDSRYLACSLETRSEIVVPIQQDGRILGEIDIDSHTPDAFGSDDRETLEEIARLIAPHLAEAGGGGKRE